MVYGFNKNRLALVQFDRQFNATVLPFTNPPKNNFYVGDIYNNRYYFYRFASSAPSKFDEPKRVNLGGGERRYVSQKHYC